jgi:hypothetical protein
VVIFKVLSQRNETRLTDGKTFTFVLLVVPIEGEIEPGMQFIAYDTHHSFTVTVRLADKLGVMFQLTCETTWPVYEKMLEGAVINNSGTVRGQRFYYDHENKYGHIAP